MLESILYNKKIAHDPTWVKLNYTINAGGSVGTQNYSGCATLFNGNLYLFGSRAVPYYNLNRYNIANNTIDVLQTALTQNFNYNEAALIDSLVYVRGIFNRVYSLDLTTGTIKQLVTITSSSIPSTWSYYKTNMAAYNGKLYIIGGTASTGTGTGYQTTPVRSIFEYDPIGNKVTEKLSNNPYLCSSSLVASDGAGNIYLSGGYYETGSGTNVTRNTVNTLVKYNVPSNTVIYVASNTKFVASEGAAIYSDGRLYTYGGRTDNSQQLTIYDFTLNMAASFQTAYTPAVYTEMAYTSLNNELYMFGGYTVGGPKPELYKLTV